MKKIIHLCTLFALLITVGINVAAQKTAVYAQTTTQLMMEKFRIKVENFTFSDVLGPENQLQHTASFDFQFTDEDGSLDMLRSLQVFTKERISRQLIFTTNNYSGEPIQQRIYDNTIVEEIILSALDATVKNAFKATVRIRAGEVKLEKSGIKQDPFKASKGKALACNYSLSVGSLPATRVTKISGLSIKPAAGQYTNFTIEVMPVDGAAWNQWFLTGAGGIKTEQGSIRLLAYNLKDVLFTIYLTDVEIVSYSNASGNQGTGRATIGLRTKGIAIK